LATIFFVAWLMIVLFIMSQPSASVALTVPKFKFKIEPSISLSGQLDTNFFWAEENEREVYTYLIQPGIRLGAETAKSSVRLNYTLEGYLYEDKSDVPPGEKAADDDNYIGHLVVFDARYLPTTRLTLGLDEFFYRTRDPALSDVLSNSIDRRKYNINRLTPLLFYDFKNRFSAGLRYRWQEIDYVDTNIDDSTEHRLFFNVLYTPARSMTFDLDFQHWTLDYKEGGFVDYTSDQLKLSLQKRYKFFAFEGGLGYHNRSFEAPIFEDRSTVAYKLAIIGQNPPPPETKRYLGKEFRKARSHIYLVAERNFNNLASIYTGDRFTLSVGHVFWEKILTRVGGYYQKSDYENFVGLTPAGNIDFRDDEISHISGSVGYLIKKRIALTFTTGNRRRDSNLAGFSFDNTFFILRLDFNYDIGSRGGFGEEGAYYY
jgi:hypothetical protein